MHSLPMSIMICRVVRAQHISSVESSLSEVEQAPSSKFSISPPAFMSLESLSTRRFSFLMLTLFESLERSRD